MTGEEEVEVAAADAGAPAGDGPATADVTPPARPPAVTIVADGVAAREGCMVTLEVFEGPIDLLLHLVRRHELDILDIPISFITDRYLEYLEFARALDIEIAGDYLVMAATLAFLKSRELLPPDPTEEEEDLGIEEGMDPREELIRRLVEYERFRAAGDELDTRPMVGRDVFLRGGDLEVEPEPPGLAPVTLFRLADAYNRVLERARISKSHDVELEPISVRVRMHQLGLMLREREKFDFEEMFLDRVWSSERELRQNLVVTLMSLLEMVKIGVLTIHQPLGSNTLQIERAADDAFIDEALAQFQPDEK